jgi:hypothetical protein
MIDSGSDISCIPLQVYNAHFSNNVLTPVPESIQGYDGTPIVCYGKFAVSATCEGRQTSAIMYVVSDDCKPIVGVPEIHAFDLITIRRQSDSHIATIGKGKADPKFAAILSEFPELTSSEMGLFPNFQHKIRLKSDTQPFASKARPVPLRHREKVKKEVFKMVEDGTWSPIEKSDWAHPMVVVPKPNGDVRVTTDLRRLNDSVIPDRYPPQHPKEVYLSTKGSTLFTTLDLRKAYWSIEMAADSRPYTATITPWGLFAYNRMPMGLVDSGNVFQRKVDEIIQHIPNCEVYIH